MARAVIPTKAISTPPRHLKHGAKLAREARDHSRRHVEQLDFPRGKRICLTLAARARAGRFLGICRMAAVLPIHSRELLHKNAFKYWSLSEQALEVPRPFAPFPAATRKPRLISS